jgi:hypothetical protein
MTPSLTATGERFYELLEPLAQHDEDNGWALAYYSDGYAAIIALLAELVADDGDVPGWAAHIFSPDTEPAEWLPVTELFVGVTPYPAVEEAGRRLRIKHVDGRYRGTPGSIKNAARQFLVGPDGTPETATVYLIVRVGGVATDFTVSVLASQTPDVALVEAAVLEQTPAGFNGTVSQITGGTWADLTATHADWAEVDGDFTDWAEVRSDPTIT